MVKTELLYSLPTSKWNERKFKAETRSDAESVEANDI